ncbi:MAG: HAMP domain-containing histidine kinase [Telmatospirillum sp.]|nr:HAMP domain-containing histidine kinase [Telmatospirillum sp.]
MDASYPPPTIVQHRAASQSAAQGSIDRYVLAIEPVVPSAPCAAVYDRFVSDPDLLAVPICTDGRPLGLIDRYHFLRQLAHSYGRALFANKPATVIMDRDPLIVDRGIDIVALQHLIADDRPSALTRGFIVVANGRYVGMGAALGLLRASLSESAALNRRLAEALETSESASRLKSRFFANLSHELRTPLNAIIGFAEIMSGAVMGPIDRRYREYADDIHASGKHLLSLINDLLDMAKLEAGEMRAERQATDLAGAVESTLRMVREAARRAHLTLIVEIDEPAVPVEVDPRHLRQILLNLLSNAVKFTRAGGCVAVRLRSEASTGPIVEVADTGIGMTQDEIELALKPFGQVASSLARDHDGTGLGLPLVTALCDLNGIGFRIASAPGEGTRVTLDFCKVELPQAQKAAAMLAAN